MAGDMDDEAGKFSKINVSIYVRDDKCINNKKKILLCWRINPSNTTIRLYYCMRSYPRTEG